MMEFLIQSDPLATDLGILLGRLALGICFIVHAFGKLGWIGTGSMDAFTGWLKALGLPMPGVQAYAAMLTELVGGALLALGLLTRPACLALFGTMMVAAFLGHKGAGYLITNDPPGKEYALNLGIIVLVFFLLGPGRFSLDSILLG